MMLTINRVGYDVESRTYNPAQFMVLPSFMDKHSDSTVTWESSDPTKVTVDQHGLITGVTTGSSIISFLVDGEVFDKMEVTVS